MKINQIFIDGFGHFHNYPIRDVSPGLTIIKGPNEAGKSTLLAFIRRMLFGKPPGRSFNPYEPLNGGEYGGRLTVETDQGDIYDIERYNKFDKYSLLDSKGSQIKAPITSIIGSADQYFYDNIFAFGLEELYKFESLSDESIQNYVTGAGVGIKNCSIPDLHKKIRDESESFYKKGARKTTKILNNINNITEIEKKLKTFSKTQKEYDQYQKQKREETEELQKLKSEKSGLSKDRDYFNSILGVWDEWTEYQRSSERLSSLPEIEKFPQNGINDLDRIIERIREREEVKIEKERELEGLEIDYKDILINESVLKNKNEIRNLDRGLEKRLSDEKERNDIVKEIGRTESEYLRHLSDINPDWDENNLISFDLSSKSQSKVADFKQKFVQYNEEQRDLNKELQVLEDEIEHLQPSLKFYTESLNKKEDLPTKNSIKRQKIAIEKLYTKLPELSDKKRELESVKEKEAEANERWRASKAILSSQMPMWPAGLILIAGFLSLGFGILNNSTAIGSGLFILFIIIAGIYYLTAKKHKNQQDRFLDEDSASNTEDNVIHWSNIRKNMENDIQNTESQLVESMEICGFAGIPSVSDINIKRSELEELAAEVTEKENHESQKMIHEDEINSKKLIIEEKESEITRIKSEYTKLESEWKKWLKSVSLSDDMLPEIVSVLFPKVEQASAEFHALKKNKERLDSLEKSIESYEERVKTIFEECKFQSYGTIEGDVESAVAILDQNITNQDSMNSLTGPCKKLRAEIDSLSKEIESLQLEKSKLLEKGSSEDEEQFRDYAGVWDEREQLRKSIDTNRNKLERVAGKDTPFDEFVNVLETLDYSDLKGKTDDLKDSISGKEDQIEKKNESIGQFSELISQLEKEDEFAYLESQKLSLSEDLHDNSREWAKRVIAAHLLNKAVERYEKERQPAVIQEATSIFSGISNGRYQRIIKPLDSDAFIIEEASGGRKEINQLSRGTAEQLYLSLRFGYITEYGKHDVGLPVVFDDVLVNFDPVRKENSCKAIAKLADINQIMYFTCHPETVELLKESRPDAVVIDLEGEMS